MKRIGLFILSILLGCSCFAEMFGGTIAFKDGGTVEFVRLGNDKPYTYTLYGKLGAQRVEYKFEDLGQIILSSLTEMIVVSKQGERFALTECRIYGRPTSSDKSTESVIYRYLDPVTSQEQNGSEYTRQIASITIGTAQGDVKKSPTTGEFFPSIYNFDPFTGEKLEWTKMAE